MSAKNKDTLYLAIGGLAVLGAGAWAALQQSDISELEASSNAPSGGAAYEPAAVKLSSPASLTWADAPSQSAGEKWIYDVFTPPEIYYNTETKQFTVVPPPPPGGGGVVPPPPPPPPPPFGATLAKVEQPLFRLQLVGYVGEGEQARGNFLNTQTGAVIFGTTGKKLPDLNLEIVSFSAERRAVPQAGGTTLVFVEVKATVRDTETGKETKLDAKTRVPDGPLAASLKLEDGTERVVRAGDTFTVGEHTFNIGALTLDPPAVEVTKKGGTLPEPETRTLLVPPPEPPPPDPNAPPAAVPSAIPEGFPTGGAFPGF